MTTLKFQILTWNVGSSDPPAEKKLVELLQVQSSTVDVLSVYLQEIETGLVETAKSFVSHDEWTKCFMNVLNNIGYFLVENVRVQGITLSVFALIKHLPFIRYIKSDIERTGALLSTWGNKGGIAISASFYNHDIVFVNTHLAAHLSEDNERVDDFKEVIDEIDFDGKATIFDHEIIFWAGDMNFRLEEIGRDEAIAIAINETSYEKLLQYDQLKKHLTRQCIFKGFIEGPICFPPTYKFDRGTNVYDSSEKQRKPAYTDRILHRVNPDKSFVHDYVKMQLNSSASQTSYANSLVKQVPGSYKSLPNFKQSDHKPVTAQYLISLSEIPTPLVELKVEGQWTEGSCNVTIIYHHGMVSDDKDYLALYEENFSGAKSYKTFKYVGESSEKVVTETFRRIFKFSYDKGDNISKFRIGYFSNRMSCLLALTQPFFIKS